MKEHFVTVYGMLLGVLVFIVSLAGFNINKIQNAQIELLNQEIVRIDLETMELQQQVLELRLEIEKRKRMQE